MLEIAKIKKIKNMGWASRRYGAESNSLVAGGALLKLGILRFVVGERQGPHKRP